jgi:isopentenyldiphosphate isomerase
VREIREELGLRVDPAELEFMKTVRQSLRSAPDYINNEFDDMYILKTDKQVSEMKLQAEEVTEAFYVSFEKFREMVGSRDPELLRHEEEFEILFDYFEKI